jgi:hypothetical protein
MLETGGSINPNDFGYNERRSLHHRGKLAERTKDVNTMYSIQSNGEECQGKWYWSTRTSKGSRPCRAPPPPPKIINNPHHPPPTPTPSSSGEDRQCHQHIHMFQQKLMETRRSFRDFDYYYFKI